ncbi:molybdopterin molybdotransferase MoeA [Nocardioides bruguierae]|uniref:Molybdopterin molybdenumtransferase n=1 Tax=Nocardioides bruguierae TaxID=2945102 RepID=A0A9X2DE51_9ACTN|nr:gephyrin-like molybdotransferase Glp [Nocardioides bruguierae]MCM0622754.1 molybdopterin molybdotransferase MoeA [Nocardioides bruguierae]
MPTPIPASEHRARILAALRPLPSQGVPLRDARGRVTAVDHHACVAVPSFDNSAVDGYAVRAADLIGASAVCPVILPVSSAIGAGQAAEAVEPGHAAKIMTGAPMPEGADAVVPYEATDRGSDKVSLNLSPQRGANVRCVGEDVTGGALVVAAGTRLTPRHLGALAATGHGTVDAHREPKVAAMSTGAELVQPGQPLAPAAIYDSNSFIIASAAEELGARTRCVGGVPDEPSRLRDALEEQLDWADVIVTTGGVSAGDYDVVKALLSSHGVWFGPVALQPGKPQGFGLVGRRRVPLFALPGNPVSAFVSFELFVRPALRLLQGLKPDGRPARHASLARALTSPAGREQYLRGTLTDGVVTPLGGPDSHLVASLAQANCLLRVPAMTTTLGAGAKVDVLLLEDAR